MSIYTYEIGGVTWRYTLSGGDATIGAGLGEYGTTAGASLSGAITIPAFLNGNTVVALSKYSFIGCSGITSMSFESGSQLTTINSNTFQGCSGLSEITLPASLKILGAEAFGLIGSLAEVTFEFGSQLTTIGHNAFASSSVLTIFAHWSLIATMSWSTTTTNSIGGKSGVIVEHAPTCFPSGTPILTDQGVLSIESLTKQNSIRGVSIVRVTRSTGHKSVVHLPRNSLYKNVPSQDTCCSLEHRIFYNGRMTKARDLVSKCESVTKERHDGAPLFNVLLPSHSKMVVNNLVAETLHPQNAAARASR